MGFFGELIDEDPVSIPIPDGYQLYLSQVCIDWADVEVKGRIALMIKTANCDDERPLCILHPKKDIYNANIAIELDSEDAPVELRSVGGKLHLSGKWTWDVDADSRCGHDHGDEDEDDSEQNEEDERSDEESEAPQLVALDEPAKPAVSAVKLSTKTSGIPATKTTETGKRTQEENDSQQQVKVEQQASKKRKVEALSQTETKTTSPTTNINSNANPLKAWKVLPYNEDGIVVPTPKQNKKRNGLLFTDYIVGKGALPKNGSTVKMLYEGYFTDGTMFDSKLKRKRPFAFRKGLGQVIPGMELGIEDMRIGGARELIIPAALGYGAKGVEGIPGNQTLIFRIQLIE